MNTATSYPETSQERGERHVGSSSLVPPDVLRLRREDLRDVLVRAALEWGAPPDTSEALATAVVGALAADQATHWPKPHLPGPPEPEPLPLDALPPALRRWAETVARSVQVSPDMTVLLALCAVSAAVAGKVVVRLDGAWVREWVTLYGVLVAPPGERKSPAFHHMTAPLREWESERRTEVAPKRSAALNMVDVAERKLADAKKTAAKGSPDLMDAVEAASLDLDAARDKVPALPELLAQDSTPEALVRQMSEQGGRVAVLSPEGGPLRVFDGRWSDGVARLEEIAQGYDGEELCSRRISRDDLRVRSPALTLGVALQPSVLKTVRNTRSLRGQGIYGRITWVFPPSRMGERVDSSEAPPLDLDAERLYRDTLRTLLDWQPADVEEDGTPVPHELTLSSEAQDVKAGFHYEIEARVHTGGDLQAIPDWANKTVGRAVRIATFLELAARAGDGRPVTGEPISGWAMQSAVRICRALTTHALHAYGQMEMDERASDLRYLLRRLQDLEEGSTVRDLHRAVQGRKSIETSEDLDELLEELEHRGCIRRVHAPSDGPGRPPSPTVELHPALRKHNDSIDRNIPDEGVEEGFVNSVHVDAGGGNEVPEILEGLT